MRKPARRSETGTSRNQLAMDDLDLQTAALLVGYRLAEAVQTRLAAAGFPGLSFSDGFVVQHLIDDEPTVSEIARWQGVTTQAVSQRLRTLERLGYVERSSDPDDRRVRRVHLTGRGRDAVAAARRTRREVQRELADLVGSEAVDQTVATLRLVLHHTGADRDVARRMIRPPQ